MFLLRNKFLKSFLVSTNMFNPSARKHATKTKKPILFGDEISPPVRFVMMTTSMLNVEVEFRRIDLFNSENKNLFYKKINLLQKVPTLVVDDEIICDSHAIALFLCRRSETQDLYPKDPVSQARVDEMLFFNSSTLFSINSTIFTEFFAGKWPINVHNVRKWNDALGYLEHHLNKYKWLAGNQLTLSDLCCGATVSSLQLLIRSDKHFKVDEWMNNLKKLPCFDINAQGLMRLQKYVNEMKLNIM